MLHHAAGPGILPRVGTTPLLQPRTLCGSNIMPSIKKNGKTWLRALKKPIVQNGYVKVPEKPGIGVELNEEVVQEFIIEGRKNVCANSGME